MIFGSGKIVKVGKEGLIFEDHWAVQMLSNNGDAELHQKASGQPLCLEWWLLLFSDNRDS